MQKVPILALWQFPAPTFTEGLQSVLFFSGIVSCCNNGLYCLVNIILLFHASFSQWGYSFEAKATGGTMATYFPCRRKSLFVVMFLGTPNASSSWTCFNSRTFERQWQGMTWRWGLLLLWLSFLDVLPGSLLAQLDFAHILLRYIFIGERNNVHSIVDFSNRWSCTFTSLLGG